MKTRKFKQFLSTLLVVALTSAGITVSTSATEAKDNKQLNVTNEKKVKLKDISTRRSSMGLYLVHIQYSFAMVDPATNKIAFGDKHAAIEEDFKDMNITHKGKTFRIR